MEEIINDLMSYEGIKIFQRPDMFNFSIDSLLLASFATIKKSINIIDLCSGNAPIPLYLSLRTSCLITGVEIQKDVYDLGVKSIKYNNLENQITYINDNLIGISKKLNKKYDLVTCNPPYFIYNKNSNTNKNDYLTIARHEVLVKLEDVIKEAYDLLNDKGYFSMVYTPERLIEVIETFKKYNIEPKRLRFVYPKKNKKANHILIEGIKNGNKGKLIVLNPLILYNSTNKWTKEVQDIYNYRKVI